MTEPRGPAESGEPLVGWLPRGATEIFGAGARAEEAYGLLTVDVPAERWIAALETARDDLGCSYFDWLSAVDEPDLGFQVCAHVAALPDRRASADPTPDTGGAPTPIPAAGTVVRRLLVRTTVSHEEPVLPTATGVYAGAGWHERETYEMFGVTFADHPHLVPLLLPDGFEGYPLRKEFVLAARVVKAWPGAKEPGESGHGGPKRRQTLPPGVPDPNEWGPLKGQLPPAPSRPARRTGGASAGDRPARRDRAAGEGPRRASSAGAVPEAPGATAGGSAQARPEAGADRPARRPRTTSDAPWLPPRPPAAEPPAERTEPARPEDEGRSERSRTRDEPARPVPPTGADQPEPADQPGERPDQPERPDAAGGRTGGEG